MTANPQKLPELRLLRLDCVLLYAYASGDEVTASLQLYLPLEAIFSHAELQKKLILQMVSAPFSECSLRKQDGRTALQIGRTLLFLGDSSEVEAARLWLDGLSQELARSSGASPNPGVLQ